jgi:hypothetical protein
MICWMRRTDETRTAFSHRIRNTYVPRFDARCTISVSTVHAVVSFAYVGWAAQRCESFLKRMITEYSSYSDEDGLSSVQIVQNDFMRYFLYPLNTHIMTVSARHQANKLAALSPSSCEKL